METPSLVALGLTIGLGVVGIDLAQAYLGQLFVKVEHLVWGALTALALIAVGMLIWCFTLDGARVIRGIILCVLSAGFCVYALVRLKGHGYESGKPVMIEVTNSIEPDDDADDAPTPENPAPAAPGAPYIVGDDAHPTEKTRRARTS